MLATYASFLATLATATLVGQGIVAACGRRSWSPLSPAIGLAALLAIASGAVRLPGEGLAVAVAVGLAAVLAAAYLRGRASADRELVATALALAALAGLAASLPFIVEGRFGILGTGLNPDMSQHLFATDRLASGGTERLISEGYPLGPHALVTGLAELGPSTVHAFGGLIVAVAVAASLAPLAVLGRIARAPRIAAALTIGFAYLVASYLVQGAFKETIQALFVLAFAISLHELAGEWRAAPRARRALAAVPLAVLAVGSAYAYSFPGLAWLLGAAGIWAAIELTLAARSTFPGRARRLAREAAPAAAVGVAVLCAAIAPEASRMVEFARFETFDPDGPGLGNLFDRLSPLEALGVWPSGDFRVEPGGGFAPAVTFYLAGALALAALAIGLWRWLERGERAVPAALGAAAVLWLYSLTLGTPYQEAKALALLAPLAALVAVRGLSLAGPRPLALAYVLAAAGSAALVLANGPVGPASYSPALAELRPTLGSGSVLVLAPDRLLREEHGRDYLVWELRGNRICVDSRTAIAPGELPRGAAELEGIAEVLVVEDVGARQGAPEPTSAPEGFRLEREGPGYLLYAASQPAAGPGPCPLISDGRRADPGAAE